MWKRILPGLIILGLVVACYYAYGIFFALADFWKNANHVRDLAFELAPPPYPGSNTNVTRNGGGSAMIWEETLYITSDPLSLVLEYYDQAMPNPPSKHLSENVPAVSYYAENQSPEAIEATCRIASHFPCDAYAPNVTITVYEVTETEEGPLVYIEVRVMWYAP
jgi:hypothetical protein